MPEITTIPTHNLINELTNTFTPHTHTHTENKMKTSIWTGLDWQIDGCKWHKRFTTYITYHWKLEFHLLYCLYNISKWIHLT